MPNYENSVIYKLVHKEDQDNKNIYIGSTTNFRGRKNAHKSACLNEYCKDHNIYLYVYIRENGGWNEWEMVAVETYPCNCKRELEIRERFNIETLKPKLNKVIPTRTEKEWTKENIEKVREYKKKYQDNNKEKIKQYINDNIESIRERSKIWGYEKVICNVCGIEINKSSLKRHNKREICKKNLTK
tara:strand:+ start:95 stop:652 length:558 start_codon:yes stop_codon:yes gene_type:complete